MSRLGNMVAHKMAHVSREYREMRVCMEEVPYKVNTLVISDMVQTE